MASYSATETLCLLGFALCPCGDSESGWAARHLGAHTFAFSKMHLCSSWEQCALLGSTVPSHSEQLS